MSNPKAGCMNGEWVSSWLLRSHQYHTVHKDLFYLEITIVFSNLATLQKPFYQILTFLKSFSPRMEICNVGFT